MNFSPQFIEKFFSNVEKTNFCWNWKGTIQASNKLPCIHYDNFTYSGRRVSLEITGKVLNPKEKVLPTCRNKMCVNPDHLVTGEEDRFWMKVQKLSGDNSCWIWTAGEDHGYGFFNGDNAHWRAHQYSWILLTGRPIPDGLVVCHSCDTTRCVNPSHLFLGTQLDNMQDKVSKRRHSYGEIHGSAKLTEVIVREIRTHYKIGNISQRELASKYNVSLGTINGVISLKIWQHVI